LLVDNNGGILNLFMTLFVLYFIRGFYSKSKIRIWLLGFLLSLAIWSKIEGFVLIILSILVFYVINRDIKKGIKDVIGISIICLIIYTLTWGIYAIFMNYDVFSNLIYVSSDALGQILKNTTTIGGKILTILWTIKNFFFWTTPTFFILVGIITFKNIKKYMIKKKVDLEGFLNIYGLIICIAFLFLTMNAYGFPKYIIGAMPIFSVLIGGFIMNLEIPKHKKLLGITIILIAGLLIFNILVLKDPFIEHNIFYTKSILLENNLDEYLISNIYGILFFIPFFIGCICFMAMKFKIYHSVVLSSILCIFLLSFYVSYIQRQADYNTTYAYGQKGMENVIEYLRTNTNKDDIIVARCDIGHYVGGKYIRSYPDPPNFKEFFNEAIKNPQVKFIVINPSDKIKNYEQDFHLEKVFDHFKVYMRNR